MSTRTRVTTHAADRAPQQAEQPKATLGQLAELVGLMEAGKIDRQYLQRFLRFKLKDQTEALLESSPTPENELLRRFEAVARKYFPAQVNEILEVVAPWCDPNLDMEFKGPEGIDLNFVRGRLANAAFEVIRPWYPWIRYAMVVELDHSYAMGNGPDSVSARLRKGEAINHAVDDHMFKEEARIISTSKSLSAGISEFPLQDVWVKVKGDLNLTYHARMKMLHGYEHERITISILNALRRAMVFAVHGDQQELADIRQFLDFQRSGHPIVSIVDDKTRVCVLARQFTPFWF